MKLFTGMQIGEIDKNYQLQESIASIDLVEEAALRLFDAFVQLFPNKDREIFVFAGPGNNGADALCLGRRLWDDGYRILILLINPGECLSESCELARERLMEKDEIPLVEVVRQFVAPKITAEQIVVDGLFGTGLSRPLTGGYEAIVKYINASKATVVSIDIPSGMLAVGDIEPNCSNIIRAHHTLSIQYPKVSFFLNESPRYVGEISLLPLFEEPFYFPEGLPSTFYSITLDELSARLRSRDSWSSKREFGHAYLVAGSEGKAGAALLAARAAMRSGLGLLTVHLPAQCVEVLQTALPEAMCEADFSPSIATQMKIKEYYAAVAIGPGIGTDDLTQDALLKALAYIEGQLVIDADGLNCLSFYDEPLSLLPSGTILTPHEREFDRLFGEHSTHWQRLMKARSMAREYQVVLVLKSPHSAVVLPSGDIYFVSGRNSALAKAGSGDVLTGILLGLLAQGYEPGDAAILGCGLHALAGRRAAELRGEYSVLASDVIHCLGAAFGEVGHG